MAWPRFSPAALLVVAALVAPSAHAIPTYDEVRADFRPSDTLVLSREGEVLQRLRTDATVRRGQWVPLADVSPALRTALAPQPLPTGHRPSGTRRSEGDSYR